MKHKGHLSRREFLKLALLAPASLVAEPILRPSFGQASENPPNVIVLIFDAWSAKNVSFYGYQRDTMPNLAKFAERATVYHNHYASGTFTVPGTSSLLTGLHPWTHRAFQLGSGIVSHHADHNIFSVLKPLYNTLGYTHNTYVDQLLYQAERYLDAHVRVGAFNIQNRLFYNYFKNDPRMAFTAFEENILRVDQGYGASLFLGPLFKLGTWYDRHLLDNSYDEQYPRGMPTAPIATEAFLLEDVVDGAIGLLENIKQPGLMYLHFYPPHEPYCPKRPFFKKFKNDGWKPIYKDEHVLSDEHNDFDTMVSYRGHYDEFLASWDDEIGRLFSYLENSGLLENSYVIITSDHGEMFERGEMGHLTTLIYDPLVNIPLIISRPGQSHREDVYTNTSNVDILPTLAQITGNPIPVWAEGELLPGLGGTENPSRSIFIVDAKTNSSFAPLGRFSVSLTRERHRLTHYKYPNYEGFEFYDLDNDPEEVNDLFSRKPSMALDMQTEILDKIADVNRPYSK